MGVKLLLFFIAVFLIYSVINLIRKGIQRPGPSRPAAKPVDAVQCRHCGIYLPQSEAISDQGDYYCSTRHLEAEKQKPGD